MPYKFRQYIEPVVWITALVLLFVMDTSKQGASFCLFKAMGFAHCPGCGIGHAIHDALHLRFAASFHEHILGIPAVAILIYTIIKSVLTIKNNRSHESTRTSDDVARHAAG
jgi:hypothetical protein